MFGLNESTQYIIEVSSFTIVQLKVYSCTTKEVIVVRL